jgi:ribA/ribD-fused uncharacterized protein
MDGIESIAVFEEKIPVTPRDMANPKLNIHKLILARLAEKLEGKCSLHGWVRPNTIRVLSRSMGYIESGRFTGDIVYHVQSEAKVYNPPSGSVVVGVVSGNNKMGMYVNFEDAIRIMLPRDLHIADEAFSKVQIGERVRVEIKKSRFQVNDAFILSVGIFLGTVGSDYVPVHREEETDVEDVEERLGAAADVELGRFDEAEAARQAQAAEQAAQRRAEEAEAARQEALLRSEEEPVFEENLPPLERVPGAPAAPAQPTAEQRLAANIQDLAGPTIITAPPPEGEPILFYKDTNPTLKELDPGAPIPFTLDEKQWPTVYHYYFAKKFSNPDLQEQIRLATKLSNAAKISSDPAVQAQVVPDWETKKDKVFYLGYSAQLAQNPSVKEKLVATGNQPLVYANPNDSYYGYGRTKKGKNRLGVILMAVRFEFTRPRSTLEEVDG